MPASTQEKIKELGELLGYPSYSGGYCHGLNMKWLEASFVQEDKRFAQRIETILTNPAELIVDKINHVKTKVKQHEALGSAQK